MEHEEVAGPLGMCPEGAERTIRRGDNLNDKQIAGLTTAADESVRMRHLLDDLLDLSRSDSGRLAIVREPIALTDQLEQAVEMAHNTLKRPVYLELPDEPQQRQVVVSADGARLRQALLDLIENADKYSPNQRPIRVVLQVDAEQALIQVIDEGIGIPEADLERVFERFQRGSNAPEKTGSGLGLSIVKLLVEAMDGTIELRSRPGQGSCFTIRLPR